MSLVVTTVTVAGEFDSETPESGFLRSPREFATNNGCVCAVAKRTHRCQSLRVRETLSETCVSNLSLETHGFLRVNQSLIRGDYRSVKRKEKGGLRERGGEEREN